MRAARRAGKNPAAAHAAAIVAIAPAYADAL
jgi:hypothetical protein